MNYQKFFELLQKNEIHIAYRKAKTPLPLGASKIGGKPQLPRDFEWFSYEGEGWGEYDGFASRPLSFLMQLNCAEVKPYDHENMLPETGMLYFFYDQVTMKWGFEPEDKGSARVFYYDGDIEALSETDFPPTLEPAHIFPEMALTFTAKTGIPSYEEFTVHIEETDTDWEDYDKAAEAFGIDIERDPAEISKLLGYADLVQGEMLWECESVTRGYSSGNGPLTISKEESAEIHEKSLDWVLLMQLGTVTDEESEWMWGDCGCLYFYIRKDDLKKKNFEDVWVILQCG